VTLKVHREWQARWNLDGPMWSFHNGVMVTAPIQSSDNAHEAAASTAGPSGLGRPSRGEAKEAT